MASNFSTLQPTGTTPAGIPVFTFGDIEFVKVLAGTFLMGSKNDNVYASSDEKPQHTVDIPYDYWMARFPMTNEQYMVNSGRGKQLMDDWQEKKDHPVDNVTWKDAMAYCKLLNDLLKYKLPDGLISRLPTEAEWEKAARGTEGREWPWGNEFDKNNCNSNEGIKGGTTPVSIFSPQGDSPYGCADMAGNIWEWCHSFYKAYPYKADDGREDEKLYFVGHALRGGSFLWNSWSVRCASRLRGDPDYGGRYCGFRVVVAQPISEIIRLANLGQ